MDATRTLICTIIHAPFNDIWRPASFVQLADRLWVIFASSFRPSRLYCRCHSPFTRHIQPLLLVMFFVPASIPNNVETANHLPDREEADNFSSNYAK